MLTSSTAIAKLNMGNLTFAEVAQMQKDEFRSNPGWKDISAEEAHTIVETQPPLSYVLSQGVAKEGVDPENAFLVTWMNRKGTVEEKPIYLKRDVMGGVVFENCVTDASRSNLPLMAAQGELTHLLCLIIGCHTSDIFSVWNG
jgi:hypothetical protein